MRLEEVPSAAIGLVLAMLAHAVGWPVPRGGSQRIADALAAHLRFLGGEIRTGFRVEHLDQLPLARATLFNLTPLPITPADGSEAAIVLSPEVGQPVTVRARQTRHRR